MDRKFLLIAGGAFVVLIIIVVVLVIGSKGKVEPKAKTLTFWNLNDKETVFKSIIEEFQTIYNVKIQYEQKNPEDYLSDLLNEIAAGKGPDIVALPHDFLPKYHQLLLALPSGKMADKKQKKTDIDIFKETYPDVVGQDSIISGNIYGLPLSIDVLKLFYNPELFSEARDEARKKDEEIADDLNRLLNSGPQNWDEFNQLATFVTKKSGDNLIRSAAALGTADNIPSSVDILTLLMLQNGAKMTADDFSSALFQTNENVFGAPTPPGTKALEFYTGFANKENKNYTWNSSMPNALAAFAEGKTAMMIDYSRQEKEIKRLNPNLDYNMIDVPQIKATKNPLNYASYLVYGVGRNSPNAALAWDFIIFTANSQNASFYTTETKKPAARLDKIDSNDAVLSAQSWFKPNPEKADEIFRAMIKQVNAGQSAQSVIEAAASQISNLLKELKE